MRRPIVKLITFGSGSRDFLQAADRVIQQALEFELIDEAKAFNEQDLSEEIKKMFSPNSLSDFRGFGFWIWKPYIINEEIRKLEFGDILIYVDAGAEVNKHGQSRFSYYLDTVVRSKYIIFSMPYQHRFWTKEGKFLSPTSADYFRNQLSAGFMMFYVCPETVDFTNEWLRRCLQDSGHAVRDVSSEFEIQLDGYKDHRHDQSVLSKLAFERGIEVMAPDETYFSPWKLGADKPFLLMRNRTGVSRLRYRISSKPRRLVLYLLSPVIDRDFAKERIFFYLKRIKVRFSSFF